LAAVDPKTADAAFAADHEHAPRMMMNNHGEGLKALSCVRRCRGRS
jgi:hypothetical protein